MAQSTRSKRPINDEFERQAWQKGRHDDQGIPMESAHLKAHMRLLGTRLQTAAGAPVIAILAAERHQRPSLRGRKQDLRHRAADRGLQTTLVPRRQHLHRQRSLRQRSPRLVPSRLTAQIIVHQAGRQVDNSCGARASNEH